MSLVMSPEDDASVPVVRVWWRVMTHTQHANAHACMAAHGGAQ